MGMPNPWLSLVLLGFSSFAVAGGSLRYAEDRGPAIVNPLFATTMSEARLNELVFDGLFTDDLELRSVPRLATSLELAADGRSARVHLRRDVRWHDGEPFDAHDVVFTIQAMKHPGTASSEAARVGWIREAVAVDEHTVELHFENVERAPQDRLHFKILPQHRFPSTEVSRSHPFRTTPVGTGPYSLVSFNDDASITLQRNPLAPEPASVDTIVLREVADNSYQAKLLLYESLEVMVRVLPRDLAVLRNARHVELYPYQTNSWWYVGFNHDDSRLRDQRVREAVASFVDVQALLAPIGTGERITGPFVPSSPFYDHEVAARPHDPELGRRKLTEAGYIRDGHRWLDAKGRPLTLRVATIQGLETAQDVVINLQSQLQSQGVRVEPEFLGLAEWKRRVWQERDYDLVLGLWSFDRNEDVYEHLHSRGSRNLVRYVDPEVDALLDRARLSTDPQEKKQLMRRVHAEVADDLPMIFLWTLDSWSAVSTRVRDVVVHPFYFFTWARDWTIE